MSLLQSVVGTRINRPPRIVIHGPHGIGKSTFGSQAPRPIFIRCEDGLDAIDAQAFPVAQSLADVEAAIFALINEPHDFQTVVLDSADWLETLIWSEVCRAGSKADISDFDFQEGYTRALAHWERITEGFDVLRNRRNMAVIMLAHTQIVAYPDPTTATPYDRYDIAVHKRKAAPLLKEWADVVGFANYRVVTTETKGAFGAKVTRGQGIGERLLYLSERPAWVAKSRYPLPDEIPFSWAAFAAAFAAATNTNKETA